MWCRKNVDRSWERPLKLIVMFWMDFEQHVSLHVFGNRRQAFYLWGSEDWHTLIRQHFLPNSLNGNTYDIFLQDILLKILSNVPPAVSTRIWFQHNGAVAHFINNVRNYLYTAYDPYWIGQGEATPWSPR